MIPILCVNEVMAAARGVSFAVSSTVGCKKEEDHVCRQGTAREQLEASPYALTLRLEPHCLCRNAFDSDPSLVSRFIPAVLQRNCEQVLFYSSSHLL